MTKLRTVTSGGGSGRRAGLHGSRGARHGRRAEDALLAGAVDPQPVSVGRDQGHPRGLADPGAAGALRRERRHGPLAGSRDSHARQRRGGAGPDVDHLDAARRRDVVRRHAVHRRRRRLHGGLLHGPERWLQLGRSVPGRRRRVSAVDEHTVRIDFDGPMPFPYAPFVGSIVPDTPEAAVRKRAPGPARRSARTENFAPVGTGPVPWWTEFRPNDVVRYVANERYRNPDRAGRSPRSCSRVGETPCRPPARCW